MLGPGSQASRFARWLGHLSAILFRRFLAFALGCYLRWFARRLRPSDTRLFRYFRLLLVTPLREHHQFLLNSRNLRRGSLPFVSQGVEFATGGHEFGLDLGEIPDRRLVLVPLGPKLILSRR